MRTGGRSAQRVSAQPAQTISPRRASERRRAGKFRELAGELVHEAADDLVLELAVDREGLLGDLVGHRRGAPPQRQRRWRGAVGEPRAPGKWGGGGKEPAAP